MGKVDKSKMTRGEKAAHTKKWREAQKKAHATAKDAKTFAKYRLSQKGYRCVSFDTPKGYEYKGVVDLVAVKRYTREPDSLRMMLLQVKGGSARVTKDELSRLKIAAKRIKVGWNVVQKKGKKVEFKFPKRIID